ncbi:MAG: hypothetical protein EBR82_42265 [Caulobacteraceae bacterium]|nr:hypothetical protein [Caulobacteraceae bacterium]
MADTIDFKVDDKKLQQAMLKFSVAKRKTFQETLIQASRILAENLSFQTQPFSHDKSAKESGEGAVATEIGRVYDDVGNVAGKINTSGRSFDLKRVKSSSQAEAAFVRLVRSGQYEKARELLNELRIEPYFSTNVGRFDFGEEHQKARFGARKKVSRNQFTRLAVTNTAAARAYIKQISQRVGTAKAGWASCSQQLGGFGKIPAWVSRHAVGGSLGEVNDASFIPKKPFIRMTNKVPWIDKCLNSQQMQRAIDIAAHKVMQFLKISLAKDKSAAGF